MTIKLVIEEQSAPLPPVLELLLAPVLWMRVFFPQSVRRSLKDLFLWAWFVVVKYLWAILCWYWFLTFLASMPIVAKLWEDSHLGWAALMRLLDGVVSGVPTLLNKIAKIGPMHLLSGLYAVIFAVMGLFRGKVPFVEESAPVKARQYVPEKAMRGSDFIPTKALPTCVGKLYERTYDSQGNMADIFLGMCFRVDNTLVTAWHVIEGAGQLVVSTDGTKAVCLRAEAFIRRVEQDVAWIHLTEKDFSLLAMSKGSLERAGLDGDSSFAMAYGQDTHAMGCLTESPIFGKVVFSGSTTHGFSGSPYLSHNRILGMHQGYGVQNIGLSGAYLYLMLNVTTEGTESALEDFIAKQSQRGRHYPTQPTGDPDQIEVKIGRFFYRMSADRYALARYGESARFVDVGDKLAPEDVFYDDSKNMQRASARRNAAAGASGRIGAFGSAVPIQPRSRLRLIRASSVSESSDSDCQEPMPVQQSVRLESTSKNTTTKLERNRRRRQRKLMRQVERLQNSTAHGPPISGIAN